VKLNARRKKQAASLDQDSTRLFLAQYASSKQRVLSLIEQAATLDASDTNSLNAHFLSISTELDLMQQRTAEAASFLPAHDLAQTKLALSDLHKSLQAAKTSCVPRQKFGFKSRNKAAQTEPKGNEQQEKKEVTTENAVTTLARIAAETPVVEISKLENQVVYKGPGSLGGSDVMLSHLTGCTVSLADTSTAVRAHQLQNCKVFCGPVSGSFFIEDAKNCVFVIAARQARIHKAVGCDFYLGVMSQPIIELCSGVRFGPYALEYAELGQQVEKAGLKPIYSNQMWKQVQDFNWLKADASPNWSLGAASLQFSPVQPPTT